MASTLYLKMWQVFGGPGHRQKMSFQPSQTFCTRDRDVIDPIAESFKKSTVRGVENV